MARAYLDTNVVIELCEGTPEAIRRMALQLAAFVQGGGNFVVSEFVRFECLVGVLQDPSAGTSGAYDAFFASPGLDVVSLDRAAFDLAAVMRAELGIKTPDALHVGAALAASCTEFWTNDRNLAVIEPRLRVVAVP